MTCLSGDKQVAIFAARSANCIGARNKDNIDLYLRTGKQMATGGHR